MNVILLSGGSGKRLWPLSNDIHSKQFIKIFRNGDIYESMVQRVYRQIRSVDPEARITIATSKSQVSVLHNQIGDEISISIEPCRRDTFPAIALATAYLHDVAGISEDEAVVICPVDPYVDDEYFQCLKKMVALAGEGKDKLILMGIEPIYPSEKYGYIRPIEEGEGKYAFTEKPTEAMAKEYIKHGALWNGGVFAFKIQYILEKARLFLGAADYKTLFANYEHLKKISFDYAVSEQEKSIEVIKYSGIWNDLGTWNTLAEAMEENAIGNVRMNDSCNNVHVINELDIPILVMGLKDVIVSASPDGILVSDKEESSLIKPFVDEIDQQIMYAEKSWGSFHVIDIEDDSMIVKIIVNPGHRMNYHSHERRDEIWTVISGEGRTIVDDEERIIGIGDVIHMKAGQKHTVIAEKKTLQLIEIQIGKEITVSDKKKYLL